jgi:haloalkane dehalogenase
MGAVHQARHAGAIDWQDGAVDYVRTPGDRFADLPDFPFEPHYLTLANGLRLHYLDEGPAAGDVVVLLHGQPTWSYLYRSVIPPLVAQGRRVLAPDMIGYGRSDKPTGRADYSVRSHIEALVEVLVGLDLRAVTLVVQDWGGPVGLGAARRVPERIAGAVAANTALHTASPALAGRLAWACHAQADGTVAVEAALLDYQRMTQELAPFSPRLFVQGATTHTLSDVVGAAYEAPFPSEDYCAGARQLPLLMGLTPNSATARENAKIFEYLATSHLPILTAFSDCDPSTQGWAAVLQEQAPGAQGLAHRTIGDAGHFLQEDQGPALAEAVLAFLERPDPERSAN